MKRIFLKSKIHRATVTHADLDYEGSITIDRELIEAAGLDPDEIYDVTNSHRPATYVIEGATEGSDTARHTMVQRTGEKLAAG